MKIVSRSGVRLTVLRLHDDGGIAVLGKSGVFTIRPDPGAVIRIEDIEYDENLLWALESLGYTIRYADYI
jgi:hypothetical protein